MEIFFGWFVFSFIVGFIGAGRTIGFLGAFLASLFLSPLVGLLITLFSKDKDDVARQAQALALQQQQAATLATMQASQVAQQAAQQAPENPMLRAARLKKMRDDGLLTQEEFMEQIGRPA